MSIDLTAAPVASGTPAEAQTPAEPIQQTPQTEVQEEKDELPREGISFDILANGVRVRVGKTTKIVSTDQALAALLTHFNMLSAESEGKGRVLPPGVFYIEEGAKTLRLAAYYEGAVRNVNFRGTVKRRVTPNVVIGFTLSRNGDFWTTNSNGVLYYCTSQTFPEIRKNAMPSLDAFKLLPFSNVYDNARLCTGENSLPTTFPLFDLSALYAWFNVLWDSPFNMDLGVKAAKDPYRGDPPAWFKLLAERAEDANPTFPYDQLV